MKRVNETLREVVAAAITELEDPGIGFVTVTGVETSPDLRHARVFVSVLGGEEERDDSFAALGRAQGVLQGAVAREMRLKNTPKLRFEYDDTIEKAARLNKLLGE